MKALLVSILRELVDAPDSVQVSEVCTARTIALEIRCDKEDLGKVIGKNGKTISGLRALFSSIAARKGYRAVLEVVE